MLLELLLIPEIQVCSPRFSCTHKIMRSAALVPATNGSAWILGICFSGEKHSQTSLRATGQLFKQSTDIVKTLRVPCWNELEKDKTENMETSQKTGGI